MESLVRSTGFPPSSDRIRHHELDSVSMSYSECCACQLGHLLTQAKGAVGSRGSRENPKWVACLNGVIEEY